MSQNRPATAGFAVLPRLLHDARAHHEAAAQALGEVARAVGGLEVPSGRPDSAHGCAELLRQLSLAVNAAAHSTRSAGVAVGAAGTLYSAADAAAVP